MIIPLIGYEITISRKVYFTFYSTLLFLFLTMPLMYNTVGQILHMHNYYDYEENDRLYLWIIHSVVFMISMYILLMFYSPNPTIQLQTAPVS